MRQKRQYTFSFFDTEDEAKTFLKTLPRHLRRNVTSWSSENGEENKFIAWYKQ